MTKRTIHESLELLNKGELTSMQLTQETLENIRVWEPHLHAFLEVLEEDALEQAEKQDAARKAGKTVKLLGIPIAIKDLICTTEGHTTAASKLLEQFRSPYAATVIQRLKQEGAVIIGKTNLDEFAMGASNEYSAFGPVKNPWDLDRVSGGSSGGSIASVASGEVMASLGTDTGGSIRQPAGFCNVVGLKPTYGRVSRFGVIAYASSFDQVGPVTRNVKDNALLMEVLAGQDPRDATTAQDPVGNYVAACGQDVKGLKVGVPKEYFGEDVTPSMRDTVRKAVDQLASLGAELVDISLPLMHAAIPTYYLLVKAEASSNLARFDGLRYGKLELASSTLLERYMETRGKYFGTEVKRSILMGTYALSAGYVDAWYKQASKVRTLIRREFEDAFQSVDVIVGPVSPEPAFLFESKSDDPLKMYLDDLLTVPANVAGLPAMTVPSGFIKEETKGKTVELPVGMQIIAPQFKEESIYRTAYAYEQTQPWHQKLPELPS